MVKNMEKRKETWREGVKITDLKVGDIIYVHKTKSGFMITLECEFIKFEKGIVYAKILVADPPYWKDSFPIGSTVKARPTKTFLWGKGTEEWDWAHCHWFKRIGKEFISQ
jgi:hypothetical protein